MSRISISEAISLNHVLTLENFAFFPSSVQFRSLQLSFILLLPPQGRQFHF